MRGSSVRRPRYFFFCSSLPATMTGALASPFASSTGRFAEVSFGLLRTKQAARSPVETPVHP